MVFFRKIAHILSHIFVLDRAGAAGSYERSELETRAESLSGSSHVTGSVCREGTLFL